MLIAMALFLGIFAVPATVAPSASADAVREAGSGADEANALAGASQLTSPQSFNDYTAVSGNAQYAGTSTITVSGMPSSISGLSVYLRQLDVSRLDLVTIRLTSPDGTAAVDLIDHACLGSTEPVSRENFIVDDGANGPLPQVASPGPDSCWNQSGDYNTIRVSDYVAGLNTSLAALNGHPANGDWTIQVMTDSQESAVLRDGFGFILAADDPETMIIAGPLTGTQTGSSVSFGFTSPNRQTASFRCSVDLAAYSDCTSPLALSGLLGGVHTLQVIARDALGFDQSPSRVDWIVQPQTQIVSGPANGATTGIDVSFDFGSSAPFAEFECSRDDGAFVACTPPFSLKSLVAGSHTFRVRAWLLVEGALVVHDPTPATRTWTVARPDTRITVHPRRITRTRRAAFVFSSTRPRSSFRCKVDARPFVACTSSKASPFRIRVKPGRHVFRVRAKDAAGNVDLSPAEFRWRVRR